MGNERIQIAEFEIPEGKELLEDYMPLELSLEESSDGKKLKLKGKFGQVDEATANRRVYGRKVMGREIDRLRTHVESRQMYGELDHPGDGKTKLARVSHLITDLRLESDGQIAGIIEPIPGTKNGDQAIAIAKAGGKLGVSSRGFGSTVVDTGGNQVVQEDYTLVSFDLVADPANAGAYPNYVVEHKEGQGMDVEQLKKDYPALVEAIRKETEADSRDHARIALREEFESKLSEATDVVKEEALEEARDELLSDPEVAGAATVMQEIARVVRPFILREDEDSVVNDLEKRLEATEKCLAEADEARKVAMQENEELSNLAKEAFFHLHLERSLAGDERREQIEGILGDIAEFKTLDDLQERVEEIRMALSEEDEIQEEKDREIAKLEAEKKLAEDKLEQALEVSNQLAVTAYVENRLGKHPKANRVRNFLNEAAPSTKEDVDNLIEAFDEENPTSDEFNKIRRDLNLGEDEVRGSRRTLQENGSGSGQVLGVDMGMLAEMSGVHSKKG